MSELKKDKSELRILGIRIDNFSQDEINHWITKTISDLPRQKFVVTLNPEIILKGHRNRDYKNILNSADLNLCDGFGIKLAAVLEGEKVKTRYTGVDLTEYLLRLASEKKIRVLVVVSEKSLSCSEEIEKSIEKKYGLRVRAIYFRGRTFFNLEEVKNAEIVFVNFGAPNQEEFLSENRQRFPGAKLLIGVGGTFDFLTGKMKRAPRFFRKMGLEWFFRLLQEPKRIKRIINAVIIFPFVVLRSNNHFNVKVK